MDDNLYVAQVVNNPLCVHCPILKTYHWCLAFTQPHILNLFQKLNDCYNCLYNEHNV
jgi:hypothetical protein